MRTLTNAELDRRIAYAERQLAKVKPESYTAKVIADSLAYYRSQRTLPTGERLKYTDGSI